MEALHEEHEITVLDAEASRLTPTARRFDLAGSRATARAGSDLAAAGIGNANLVIACTSRDEVNLVAGMFARREAGGATTVIRTSSVEYVELWREGQLDVDFVVSSELETAYAISRIIGVPAARQTDVFADGQVQLGEFDVDEDASADVVGAPLRDAEIPGRLQDRGDHPRRRDDPSRWRRCPSAPETGSSSSVPPHATQAWSTLLWPQGGAGSRRRDLRRRPTSARRSHACSSTRRSTCAWSRRRREQALPRRRSAPEGAHLQRDGVRSRLPRARAHRPVAGGDLRNARRRQEPVCGLARPGARYPVHHRASHTRQRPSRLSTRPGSTSP